MRFILPILLILVLLSCHDSSRQDSNNAMVSGSYIPDSVTLFLLSASASDFLNHNQAVTQFREVYVGHTLAHGTEKLYVLCGQFQTTATREEWIPFATIKTSGYEQWLGAQALSFCEDSAIKWDKQNNLSTLLKSELDALSKAR